MFHKLTKEVARLAADIEEGEGDSYSKFRAMTSYIVRISDEMNQLDRKEGRNQNDDKGTD